MLFNVLSCRSPWTGVAAGGGFMSGGAPKSDGCAAVALAMGSMSFGGGPAGSTGVWWSLAKAEGA